MFRTRPAESGSTYRLAIAGLLAFSIAALAITVWVMVDFLREQRVVQGLVQELPPDSAASAVALAGELRWQFRLTILVMLNLVVTGLTVMLLWRAYHSAQESLRDFEALADDVLISMDQAVITTDLKGCVTSINRRGIDLLGIMGDCVGRPLRMLSDEIPLEDLRRESRSGGPTPLIRDIVVSDDGAFHTLQVFCQPLRNHENADIGNIVQLRDVTERALIEERMRRMERYMGLGSLAAGLHHEIKNPLAALSLHVQLLEEQLEESDASESGHEMLRVIKAEISRVGAVLESFRDFAALGKLSRSDVDVRDILNRQLALVAPQAEARHIVVHVEAPAEPLPEVYADRLRLEQVLLNLLVNAMEAMPDGGTVTVRLATCETPEGESIRMEIIDTGSGIPESIQDRIFDAYFTTKSNGTGMGLALCDKIIGQHDGTLDYRPTDEGTTFEIILPTARTSHSRQIPVESCTTESIF
ncbi:MAG: ATP-binding protein [Pirellulales bacterium]